jgi:hypothetical protein
VSKERQQLVAGFRDVYDGTDERAVEGCGLCFKDWAAGFALGTGPLLFVQTLWVTRSSMYA